VGTGTWESSPTRQPSWQSTNTTPTHHSHPPPAPTQQAALPASRPGRFLACGSSDSKQLVARGVYVYPLLYWLRTFDRGALMVLTAEELRIDEQGTLGRGASAWAVASVWGEGGGCVRAGGPACSSGTGERGVGWSCCVLAEHFITNPRPASDRGHDTATHPAHPPLSALCLMLILSACPLRVRVRPVCGTVVDFLGLCPYTFPKLPPVHVTGTQVSN
jgi:hypothetical protein